MQKKWTTKITNKSINARFRNNIADQAEIMSTIAQDKYACLGTNRSIYGISILTLKPEDIFVSSGKVRGKCILWSNIFYGSL